MTEHDRPLPDEPGGGGMTGATGKLTPDSSDDEFAPAEWRESVGSGEERNVTAAVRRESDQLHAGAIDDPERLRLGDPHDYSTRDAGYGSEHGLSASDPAYRMEHHPSAAESDEDVEGRRPEPPSGPGPQLGGDVQRSPEDEHF
jgi:hypothetical protein